jgi:hypothetical protein
VVYNDDELKASIARRQGEIEKLAEAISLLNSADKRKQTAEKRAEIDGLIGKWSADMVSLHEQNQQDAARLDFNAFVEAVCVDDETGEPIKQAPIHRRWADLMSQHQRLIIWSHVAAGKTTQATARIVWEIARNPTLRCVVLSNTQGIASKIVKAVAALIKNDKVKRIFPHLKEDPDGPWTTTEVKIRDNNSKDPSVRAVGLHGALTSARVDLLLVDDILDPECVDTPKNRQKVSEWFRAVALGRLSANAKIIIIGNAFHPDDLLHELSKKKGWKWVRFPVKTPDGRISWPEQWSQKRIDKALADMGPAEFARQLLCKSRDDDESRFKQLWIDAALKKGNGLELVHKLEDIPEEDRKDCVAVTGVDLGIKKHKKADRTSVFTFLEDPFGNRRLLNIQAGKFTAPEIIHILIDVHRRYGSIIGVENNAAQDFLLQFSREVTNLPIVPHTTTKKKHDPVLGVEGLAVELANGKWAIPNDNNKVDPEVGKWIEEMLFYSPKSHTGDTLMASYIARDVARKMLGNKSMPSVAVRVMGAPERSTALHPKGRSILQRLFNIPVEETNGEADTPAQ